MAHHENPSLPALPPTPAPDAPGEPALAVGAAAAAVGAVLTLLTSFGVDLTESQTKAILGVVLVVGPLVLAWITRSRVWSPRTVARKIEAVQDSRHGSGGGL